MDGTAALTALNDAAETMLLFRGIKNDAVIHRVLAFTRALIGGEGGKGAGQKSLRALISEAAAALVEKAEEHGISGNIYRKYVTRAFLDDENVFSLACERGLPDKDGSLYKLAGLDAQRMIDIMNVDFASLCRRFGDFEDLSKYVPAEEIRDAYVDHISVMTDAEAALSAMALYYREMGCGVMARYRAFRYEGGSLAGVGDCDPSILADIVGYESQKKTLAENTEDFLEGKPANNVLLVGARGTGKSSCVKALYNEYNAKGLRVVEVAKDRLDELPRLVNLLKKRGKKFILFIDDLSFDDYEAQYKHMKSLIEGGVEETPKNVLFYATSNRRHIITEKWSDKDGTSYEDGELHASDTVNEKLSLSDRFGVTITFGTPSPAAYANIVSVLAKKIGLDVDEEHLAAAARQWEMEHHGLSGRSAKQFVNHLACEIYR